MGGDSNHNPNKDWQRDKEILGIKDVLSQLLVIANERTNNSYSARALKTLVTESSLELVLTPVLCYFEGEKKLLQ